MLCHTDVKSFACKIIDYTNHMSFLASSCGLVVKAEDSCPSGTGFLPPLWRPFFRYHLFGSKAWNKNCGKNSNLALLHML